YQSRARRVTDEDWRSVRRKLVMELNGARELLEGAGRVGTALRVPHRFVEFSDVDANDEGAEITEAFGHGDDAEIPSAVTGDKEHHLGWVGWTVDHHLAECRNGQSVRVARQNAREHQAADNCEGDRQGGSG